MIDTRELAFWLVVDKEGGRCVVDMVAQLDAWLNEGQVDGG